MTGSPIALGASVSFTASITNHSAASCTVATGPTSPSFSVLNANGATVWRSCSGQGGAGVCAQYLMLRRLTPRFSFAASVRWDQTSLLTGAAAPAGTYRLVVRFTGVAARAVATFRLVAPSSPHTVTVSNAENGHTVTLRVGDTLVIHLTGPASYTWSAPISADPQVLARLSSAGGASASATFRAATPGGTRVTSVDNPNCYPQCLPPSRLYAVTVTVIH